MCQASTKSETYSYLRPYILLDPLLDDVLDLDLFDDFLEEVLLPRLLFELGLTTYLLGDLLEDPRLLFELPSVELDPLLFDELLS